LNEAVRALLAKAERSFNAAELLLKSGSAEFAVSRLYYGAFYIAEALLLDEGLSFSSHRSVIGEYGRLFAKTERLDRGFHALLVQTFSMRQSADYAPTYDPDGEAVRAMIEEGRAFLDAARSYLERQRGGSG